MIDLPEVFPVLHTKQLVLCEQDECHIPQTVTLANTEDVAKMLSSMPYPYTRKDAKAWIEKVRQEYMQKAGMKREGIRRAHFKKGEEYLDVHDWGF